MQKKSPFLFIFRVPVTPSKAEGSCSPQYFRLFRPFVPFRNPQAVADGVTSVTGLVLHVSHRVCYTCNIGRVTLVTHNKLMRG